MTHLALVCDLSQGENDRIWLNSIRNAFTVVSAIIVHISLMLLLGSDSKNIENDGLNSTSGIEFRNSLVLNLVPQPYLNLPRSGNISKVL